LWSLYNGRHTAGEHVRVFPLSNWTELDVWHYIARHDVPIPELYYAHHREVFARDGMWLTAGEWGGDLPVLLSIYLDREPDAKVLREIDRYHISILAYMVEKMMTVEEGNGTTLLDNSMILYGSGISDGDRHDHVNLPVIVVGKGGGSMRSGQHLKCEQCGSEIEIIKPCTCQPPDQVLQCCGKDMRPAS